MAPFPSFSVFFESFHFFTSNFLSSYPALEVSSIFVGFCQQTVFQNCQSEALMPLNVTNPLFFFHLIFNEVGSFLLVQLIFNIFLDIQASVSDWNMYL